MGLDLLSSITKTNNYRMESATKLVRVLKNKYIDIHEISVGDILQR